MSMKAATKHKAIAVALVALFFSTAGAFHRPLRKYGPGLIWNLAGSDLPLGMHAVRAPASTMYPQTGANTVRAVTTQNVWEDIGTRTPDGEDVGGGQWTFQGYVNDVTNAFDFSTLAGWVFNSTGIRQAGGTIGPDGSINGTYIYDAQVDESASQSFPGVTSTTGNEISASVWVKRTPVAKPSFSGGTLPIPDDTVVGTTGGVDVEQGCSFSTDVDGFIPVVSFYKPIGAVANSHTITVWDVNSMTAVQTVTTVGEVGTGYQTQILNVPIVVTAGTPYRLTLSIEGADPAFQAEHSTPVYPFTQNHITVTDAAFSFVLHSFPNNTSTVITMIAVDVAFTPLNTVFTDPTTPGLISPLIDPNVAPVAVNPTTDWQRVVAVFIPPALNSGHFNIYPAGATPGAPDTFQLGSLGGTQYWGAQLGVGVNEGNPPLSIGTTGQLSLQMTDSTYLPLIPQGGNFHMVGNFITDGTNTSWASANPAVCLFSAASTNGTYEVFAGNQTVLSATVRGVPPNVNGLTINVGPMIPNTEFRWELEYKPGVPSARLQAWTNGHVSLANGTSSSGLVAGAIGTFTALYVGSDTDLSLPSSRRNTLLAQASAVNRSNFDAVEFVEQGDSQTSDFGSTTAMGKHIYTVAQARVRVGIGDFAFPGETTGQQFSRWFNSPQRNTSVTTQILAFYYNAGVNDINTGLGSAATITGIQTAMTDYNNNDPQAIIMLAPLSPMRAAMTAPHYADWLVVNQAITGEIAGITAASMTRMERWTGLNDGNDNLAPWCNSGDDEHPTNPAAIYKGDVLKSYWQNANKLPGGLAPTCAGFSPSHGAIGSTVTVTCGDCKPVIIATVNGTKTKSLIPPAGTGIDTQMTFVVPSGATTGTISIATPLGSTNCPGTFTVP